LVNLSVTSENIVPIIDQQQLLVDYHLSHPTIDTFDDQDLLPDDINKFYLLCATGQGPFLSLYEMVKTCINEIYGSTSEIYMEQQQLCHTQLDQLNQGIKDPLVRKTVTDNYCDIALYETIRRTYSPQDGEIADQLQYELVPTNLKDNLTQLTQFLGQSELISDFPPTITLSEKLGYYTYMNQHFDLNINIQPDELEILIPYLCFEGHIYYKWLPLPTNFRYVFDTGNYNVTRMDKVFFDQVYTKLLDPTDVKMILLPCKRKIQCYGIGGIDTCNQHGFTVLHFRITHAKLKGIFNLECLIVGEEHKKEQVSLLIGNSNVVDQSVNNLNKILRDRKISLKYHIR